MSHIDKQATIDAIYEKANEELADANHHFLAGVHMATAVVRDMPDLQQILTCDGCRNVGTYDTDFPCSGCIRREKDYYVPEG